MWWLYVDESGDLGFDFVNKRPSKFFTICILATSKRASFKAIDKAVKITVRRKINKRRKSKTGELKGSKTSLQVKEYFYSKIHKQQFGIYAITLNKRRVYDHLTKEKARVYNWIAKLVLEQIPFNRADDSVQLVLDKSKGKPQIAEFNQYIETQIKSRIAPEIPLSIDHIRSDTNRVLQAADIFAWGIFRKYEKRDKKWYHIFKEKIRYDDLYLP
ncbi:MAG: DUF3800 domain-containing protein [Candidatus Hodarchaeota archaeon]